MNRTMRDFIEREILRCYHEFITERNELEEKIIYDVQHDETGIKTGYKTSMTEVKALKMVNSKRLRFLDEIIKVIDKVVDRCRPEQRKFIEMFYFSRRRYNWADIEEATGRYGERTFRYWRNQICEDIAKEMGWISDEDTG